MEWRRGVDKERFTTKESSNAENLCNEFTDEIPQKMKERMFFAGNTN